MNFVQVYLLTSTTERVVAGLREDVFAHLVRLSPGFFTERRSGELTSRLSADLAVLQSLMSTWVSEMSRQMLFLIGGIVLLTLTHPRLTTTTLAVVPVVVGAAFLFGRRLRRASTGVQDRVAEAMASADEAFSQIRTVQSFHREADETRRFGAQLADVVDAAVHRAKLRALFFGIVGFIAFGGVVAVLWEGGQLVLDGALTPGRARVVPALRDHDRRRRRLARVALRQLSGSTRRRIARVRAARHEARPSPSPSTRSRSRSPVRGEVRSRASSFRYSPDLPEAISTTSTLRIGRARSSRSSVRRAPARRPIASLLPRFWDVTSGRITLDGIDIRDLSFADLRGSIGMVPQEPALFSGTIRENIAYARPAEPGPPPTEAEIVAAARAAHALEFIERLPERLRHARRRTRREAVRRTAPAPRDRARVSEESRRRRARRSDVESRHGERTRDRGGDGGSAARPLDADHRAPTEHRAPRRSRGRARAWADRRNGHARRAARARRPVRAPLPRERVPADAP